MIRHSRSTYSIQTIMSGRASRTRYAYLTFGDLVAISRAIRSHFPQMQWVWWRKNEEPSLHDDPNLDDGVSTAIFPEPGWRPTIVQGKYGPTFEAWPEISLSVSFGKWEWMINRRDPRQKFSLPLIAHSQLSMYYDRADAEHKRLINTVWKHFAQCMIIEGKGAMFWVGHDACRWILEGGPRRTANGVWRPPPDYVFPADNPYYAGTENILRGDEHEPTYEPPVPFVLPAPVKSRND